MTCMCVLTFSWCVSVLCVCSGCRQYVHESGMAAVRRLPSGLVWINNHLPSAMQTRKASVHLFIRIQQHAHRLAQMRAEVLRVVADVAALQTLKESF